MGIKKNHNLKKLNTFGLPAMAKQYVEIHSVADLQLFVKTDHGDPHILGGGSNVLLTGDVPGVVLKNEIKGVGIEHATDQHSVVWAGGGVVWHELVMWSLQQNLGGLENLSLIPGSVGAAPIQNIGAYGVELKDVFHHLEAVDLATGRFREFSNEECGFGYRDSVFKNEIKGKYFITKVFLKLAKEPAVQTSYGAIQQVLAEWKTGAPTIQDVSRAVIQIRRSKLPDPREIGNSGSFFKNPEIPVAKFEKLAAAFPSIVSYPLPNGNIKIPAGWLIEKAGWKGKRFGDAGCHEKQALVLVNYGSATGKEIWQLAVQIQDSIKVMFGIELMPEVNIW